jgi:tetratricopeptide (TPR) repeat protein
MRLWSKNPSSLSSRWSSPRSSLQRRTTTWWCQWFASALFVLLLGGRALGQSAPASAGGASAGTAAKSTKEYIDSATKYFQAGDYESAVRDYFAAYERKPVPALLFNIAQAQRKAGQWQQALTMYERFLREDPKSTLAPEAEANATAMRARIEADKASAERDVAERLAKQRAAEAEALAQAREDERKKSEAALLLVTQKNEKPIYKKPWFWGVLGGVVVAGVVVTAVVIATQPKDPASDLGLRVVEF